MGEASPQQPPSWLSSPPPQPIITTPTFHIRAYTLADADQLAIAGNSPEIAHRMGDRFPVPYKHSDAVYFISKFGRPDPDAGVRDHNFGIFTRTLPRHGDEAKGAGNKEADETLIGGIGFMPQPAEARFTSEIGYWLHPSVWGKGLATRVVGEFVKWAFDTFGADTLIKLQARHHAGNERSGRVLEKNGFVREGILRKAWACRDDGDVVKAAETARREGEGQAQGAPKHYLLDLYLYGLLRDDFETRQDKGA